MLSCVSISKVLQTMRTRVTYQGKQALAICFDDISSLSVSSTEVNKVVKTLKIGMTNLAKDFVPKSSKNPVIRRGSNSKSRKCTVIWTDKLSSTLKNRVLRGKLYTAECCNVLPLSLYL